MILILTLVLNSGIAIALDLPSYFPTCCLDDPLINKCIEEAAEKLKPLIKDGIKEIGIETLYPIFLPTYKIDYLQDNTSFVTHGNNFTVYGFNDYRLENLEFNPKQIYIKGKFVFKEIFYHSLYTIRRGYMFEVPVSGNGVYGCVLGPVNITFEIRASLVDKNGTKHTTLGGIMTNTTVKDFPLIWTGLDFENGAWGNSNDLLRSKSKLLAREIGPAFDGVFQPYLINYFKWFFDQLSYEKLFPC